MIEETAEISLKFADATSDLGNGNLLDINNHKANACATALVQSNNVISRMSTSSTMSNNQEDLVPEIQDCQVALKPTSLPTPVRAGEKRLMINRTVLFWSSFICFILLVGVVSLGLIIWNKNQATIRNPSTHPPSEFHTRPLPKPVSDPFCHNRSTVGFLSDLFTSGYDITRTNPLHKKVYGRPLLEHTLLRECRLLPETHQCQPSVESVVIDNLIAYQQWASRYVTFSPVQGVEQDDSVLIGAVSNVQDNDLLSIQTALMSGNLVIMTHMQCPVVNASRIHAPYVKPEYAHRLSLNTKTDEEEDMTELVEDYGAHFVEQVILGTEVIIRFTLDRKTVDFFKRKNMSFVSQATASGLYLLSRDDVSIDISKTNQKLATEFIAAAQMQIYSGSALSAPLSKLQTADRWVRSAVKRFGVISLRLKPIEDLFAQLFPNDTNKIQEKWHLSRQKVCYQSLSLGLNGKCRNANSTSSKSLQLQMQHANRPENELPTVFVLPLLLVWTNRSTVCLRASSNHCLELCRNDPLCSAATICRNSNSAIYQSKETKTISSCPHEFQNCNCALHRQQDFSHGTVSPRAMTLVPARQDLRPVTLRGFAVYGQTLSAVNRVTDLASCARLCSRTATCQIVSFSQYDLGQHKVCKLFGNMTGNELRRKGRAVTLFMMATFTPCFTGEIESERSNCPTNTNCSSFYGMCVCMPGYFKNGSDCLSRKFGYQEEVDEDKQEAIPKPSLEINGHLIRTHKEIAKTNDDHHVSSFPNKFRNEDASIWSNEHELEENFTSSDLDAVTIASITSSTTVIRPMEIPGPNSSEIRTPNSKEDLAPHIDDHTVRAVTKTSHSEPSRDSLKFSTMYSKSSYVPWQMRSWKRDAIA